MAAAKGNSYTLNRKINPQYTKEQINEIIENLLEYANSPNGLYLATFAYEQYKRSASWLHELAGHHPEMKEAMEVARQLIAGKVVKHCWIGDRNSTFGEKILPMYCDKYKAQKEWLAKLAKLGDGSDSITIEDIKKAIKAQTLTDLLKQD